MSSVSASVEASGWVVAITGTWPASTPTFTGPVLPHADFPLEPDSAAPKLVVTCTNGAGHTRTGGQATPTTWTRTMVGTKPLRRPWPESTATMPVIDEVELGGGLRRVRIALSDRVFAGETVALAFLDGWRTGMSGGSVTATNTSTRLPVPPICRWATMPYQLVTGTTFARVDLLIASHYPRHFEGTLHQAVAGVRFRVTDGTTTKEQWITAPSAGGSDALLCWGATLDLAGLTAGVVSVSAMVYPWIGAPRAIGSGHPTDATAGFSCHAETVLPICYDPAGTRYARRTVYVDTGGSADPSAVTVGLSLAAAKAGVAAATVSVAMQAMHLANVTLPAANGFPGGTRACDWWDVVLKPGQTHSMGSTAVGAGFGAKEGRLVIRGDPDDADPRANCTLATMATSAPALRNMRWHFEDCRVLLGEQGLHGVGFDSLRRVDVRGRAGFETSGTTVFASSVTGQSGLMNFAAEDFSWLSYGTGSSSTNIRPQLLRNGVVAASRTHQALCLIHVEAVRDPTVTYAAPSTAVDFGGVRSESAAVQTADQIAWGLKSLCANGRFYVPAAAEGSGTAGTEASPLVYRRLAMVNCIGVRSGPETDYKHVQIGENAWNRQEDCLWEGLTFAGQRTSFHNDPPLAAGNHVQTGVVVRNCYFDRISSKSDTFPTASGNRTGTWEIHYGVGFEGLVVGERSGIGDQFLFEYYGQRHHRPAGFPGPGSVSIAGFVDDRSNWGPNAANPGLQGHGAGTAGDYRPTAVSLMLGSACNAPVDLHGMRRGAVTTAGSTELMPGAADIVAEPVVLRIASDAALVSASMLLRAISGRMTVDSAMTRIGMESGRLAGPPAGRTLKVVREVRAVDAGNG